MATLALAAVGASVGSAVLPAGVTLFGTTLTGATIGAQVGALAGSVIDQALFGASGQVPAYKGPRLDDVSVTGSSEGITLPRLYGRAQLGGQIIWAAEVEEVVETETTTTRSGKGGFGGSSTTTTTTPKYSYFATFAVALCEGEIRGVGRIWADSTELNLSEIAYRVYDGSETQMPDSLIAAHLGTETPAFRGTAYVVFERFALEPFGRRVPQFKFEVFRAVDHLSENVRAVVLIPGTGEFSLATTPVTRKGSGELDVAENVHTRIAGTDFQGALDQMDQALPHVEHVSLVVSWFGTDLRAQHCQIRPAVDAKSKSTQPMTWSVAGSSRSTAHVISRIDGRAAYGGTPSDASVIQGIRELRARGKAVTFTPFILMDVPQDSALPDPYAPAQSQPVYPWRGRITVDPAPGVSGSPDRTAAAGAQVAALVGSAAVSDFKIRNGAVVYSGPNEWSLRRFVLHYAHVAAIAGGVDTFLLGSELRGLTQVRDGAESYPFVAALRALADDVRAVLGPGTRISYAADWSEYFGHHPADGSGDVFFHLDPLWAASNIDAVSIDLYWPLSDWRENAGHADAAFARSVYDLDYLKANIDGGEYYDWYYASDADRNAQVRTPITDGAAGKPWVFRAKALQAWWSNPHYDRPGGVERATPTSWIPESKPIWLTEVGCPAVDNGANQPNVFYDPKSSESFFPHFSVGRRDDTMQRRYVQALIEAFDPDHPDARNDVNPVSSVYGARMVDRDRIYVYAWDARPFPAFPYDTATWSDGANWQYGHWLNGRMANMPLDDVVATLLADNGYAGGTDIDLHGSVPGLLVNTIMSGRRALQPLEHAFFFDSIESEGRLAFRHRGSGPVVVTANESELVEAKPGASILTLTRAQETELPVAVKMTYIGANGDYRSQVAEARRLATTSLHVSEAKLPLMLETAQASQIAESWLYETWAARERAMFALPPSRLNVEPGDLVAVDSGDLRTIVRITKISDDNARTIDARAIDASVYETGQSAPRSGTSNSNVVVGPPDAAFLDLPILRGDESDTAGYVAIAQNPWPGPVVVYRSEAGVNYGYQRSVAVPAIMGVTTTDLRSGPLARFDHANHLEVVLTSGILESVTRTTLLSGANAAAIEVSPDTWEIIQFETADLIGAQAYRLGTLLRGQSGTDADMVATIAAGARIVVLDSRVAQLAIGPAEIGRPFTWRYGASGRDLLGPHFGAQEHAFRGLGRRPLSPVHVRGRMIAGDLHINWIRRTRLGGDSWDQIDVPLGETTEAYEIDILSGSDVVRTLTADGPSVIYDAASIAADFTTLPRPLTCVVYQLSETWGRGAPAHAAL
ncbi:MAG: glycoside hydrolase TIM-barrel-like domain-containing protein [Pseudomonadota bacterium]